MTTIRTRAVALVSAAVAVAAGATAWAASGPATAARDVSHGHDFTLRAHPGSDSMIDLGKQGFSVGDEDLLVARLTRAGDVAGRLVGNCTTVRVAQTADQLCEFVLRLHGGQLTASGTVRSGPQGPGRFVLPVLGGSGHYQGASGQLVVEATDGSSFPLRVHLR